MTSRLAHIVWHRLTGLMPGELNQAELAWLVSPHFHLTLLSRRRATMIVNRVRLFAFLFAVLTPLWSIIDYLVFPFPLWFALASMRILASVAFALLVLYYRPSGSLTDAYRAMAILFAIPTVFYVATHQLLVNYQLTGMQAAIGAGYAFLPFVLLAGLSIFPLTLLENILFALPMLLAQAVSGIISWATLDWPSFAGAFWLLTLITGVSTLAGLSQLAFMIALVRQAVRDPLTGIFSAAAARKCWNCSSSSPPAATLPWPSPSSTWTTSRPSMTAMVTRPATASWWAPPTPFRTICAGATCWPAGAARNSS